MFGGADIKESTKILMHHCLGQIVSLQGKGKLKKKAFNQTKMYKILKGNNSSFEYFTSYCLAVFISI